MDLYHLYLGYFGLKDQDVGLLSDQEFGEFWTAFGHAVRMTAVMKQRFSFGPPKRSEATATK